jgi:enoyl-CoA hydratase
VTTAVEMSYETLLVDRAGPVVTISVNRPDKLNALDATVLAELSDAVAAVGRTSRKDVAGVVLTGAGERAFSAGADIAEMAEMSPGEARSFAAFGQAVPEALERLDRPVIAAVHGYAFGGGCELALGCDLILATPAARFGQPEVSLGLIPCFGGCVRLAQRIGPARARELIYTGRSFDSEEARALGLVAEVLPDRAAMLHRAQELIEEVATRGPLAVAAAKRAIAAGLEHGAAAGLLAEQSGFAAVVGTTDMREGTSAFLEKRQPRFADC